LIRKNKIAQNTYQLIITKPDGFSFTPGQYAFLDFLNPTHTDDKPTFRAMSIASAPDEEQLMFIMRGSDCAFKKNMMEMSAGDNIIIKGPMGHVMLPQNISQPVVFIVAGVGITPARAMIKHEEYQKANRQITLLYASRTKESIALYDELQNISLDNYKPVFTLTREDGAWEGETGRINRDMIERHVDDIENSMYYIVGTKVFVESMKEILENIGIVKENMQFDNFG
jgi:ferredoxin-NADP reductase